MPLIQSLLAIRLCHACWNRQKENARSNAATTRPRLLTTRSIESMANSVNHSQKKNPIMTHIITEGKGRLIALVIRSKDIGWIFSARIRKWMAPPFAPRNDPAAYERGLPLTSRHWPLSPCTRITSHKRSALRCRWQTTVNLCRFEDQSRWRRESRRQFLLENWWMARAVAIGVFRRVAKMRGVCSGTLSTRVNFKPDCHKPIAKLQSNNTAKLQATVRAS